MAIGGELENERKTEEIWEENEKRQRGDTKNIILREIKVDVCSPMLWTRWKSQFLTITLSTIEFHSKERKLLENIDRDIRGD